VIKVIDGVKNEPYEVWPVDIEDSSQGSVMTALGSRGGLLQAMHPDGKGRVRLDYIIPARGLIGFQTEFRTMTPDSACCSTFSITTPRCPSARSRAARTAS
jgi:GTP-binding protein